MCQTKGQQEKKKQTETTWLQISRRVHFTNENHMYDTNQECQQLEKYQDSIMMKSGDDILK